MSSLVEAFVASVEAHDGEPVQEATSQCESDGEGTPYCNHHVTAKVGEVMLTAWLPREERVAAYGDLIGTYDHFREVRVTKIVPGISEGGYRVYFDFVNDDIEGPKWGASICWLNPLT